MGNNSSKNTVRYVRRSLGVYQPRGNVDTSNPPQGGSGMVTLVKTKPVVNDDSESNLNKPSVEQSGGQINNDK